MKADISELAECVHALQVARDVQSVQALYLLCRHLVCHPLSAISSPASSLAQRIVAGLSLFLSLSFV